MNLKEISLGKIKSFVQGNYNYYLSNILSEPNYLAEQRAYRLYSCKDDCLKIGVCQALSCGCPTIKRAYAHDSCNLNRFPDILPNSKWQEYKLKNNISQEFMNLMLEEIKNKED